MFRQILFTNLRWTRLSLTALSVVAFIAPAGLWRLANGIYHAPQAPLVVRDGFVVLGPMLALLAFVTGFVLVAQTWAEDSLSKHVYALSLPIPWSRYVGLRFGAGAVTLLLPTLALWLGSLFVLSQIELPVMLHAYPGTLALRFLLGALLSYALVFMIQYLSGRRAALVLLSLFIGVIVFSFGMAFTGNGAALSSATRWLLEWPGPLAVFAADWMLIDV